jgi:hypothetical protein
MTAGRKQQIIKINTQCSCLIGDALMASCQKDGFWVVSCRALLRRLLYQDLMLSDAVSHWAQRLRLYLKIQLIPVLFSHAVKEE